MVERCPYDKISWFQLVLAVVDDGPETAAPLDRLLRVLANATFVPDRIRLLTDALAMVRWYDATARRTSKMIKHEI